MELKIAKNISDVKRRHRRNFGETRYLYFAIFYLSSLSISLLLRSGEKKKNKADRKIYVADETFVSILSQSAGVYVAMLPVTRVAASWHYHKAVLFARWAHNETHCAPRFSGQTSRRARTLPRDLFPLSRCSAPTIVARSSVRLR